jgi:transposase
MITELDPAQRQALLIQCREANARRVRRRRANDAAVLRGIEHVLSTGIGWQKLPTREFGVSGSTCYKRWRQWSFEGDWAHRIVQVHKLSLQARAVS